MNIDSINSMIEEFEQADTSLSNIRNLSALYNVRTHLMSSNEIEEELNDILPSYMKYIDVKRKYQRNEIGINEVYIEMKKLCQEIKEFLQVLYSTTDTESERDMLINAIRDIL